MPAQGATRPSRAALAGALLLLTATLVLTLARSVRWPNDFAEAHWLLDYRFGFVRRGLAGQLLSWAAAPVGGEPGPAAIAIIAIVMLTALAAAVVWTAVRLAWAAAWSPAALLAGAALASSPFVVMAGHLTGYFDSVIVLLALVAVWLATSGRPWAAAAVQAVAVLVHESSVLVGFPVLCFAWWCGRRPDGGLGTPAAWSRAASGGAPLLVPVAAFLAVALAGQFTPAIEDAFSARLAAAGFIEGDMHLFVPEWLRPSFAEQYAQHSHRFAERIAYPEMFGLMLPTVAALLAYCVEAYRVPARSLTMAALPVVVFAPELLHLAAWDTVRIWAYPIAMTMLVAVVFIRTGGVPGPTGPAVRALGLAAVVVNVLAATPMLDNLADRYAVATRVVMYAPVLAVCVWLFLRPERAA